MKAKPLGAQMPRRVLVQRSDESFDLIEVPAPNEHHLQEVMKSQPQLIPAEDLGLDGELLVVGRETTLASGLIDLLCLSRSGELVLIEFKTGPQNPDFRHALAQLIDYGSDLWRMTLEDFDRGVVQRYLSGERSQPRFAGALDLAAAIARTDWHLSDEELDSALSRVAEVLRSGDFIYVVAAQRFTDAMQVSLEYLNATMRFGRFYLIEIIRLEGADLTAHAAQVVAAPPKRTGSGASTPATQASEAEFLDKLPDPAYREAMRDLLAQATSLGLRVTWRSVGASIQIQTPDRAAPLSIAWVMPGSANWQGAWHLTLGVDPGSLSRTPSVADAVGDYVRTVAGIPGGKATASGLEAYIFEPAVVPKQRAALAAALEQLVAAVSDQE